MTDRTGASGRELGTRLRQGDLAAAPAALNLLESRAPDAREQAEALLAEVSPAALGHEPPAHIIGVTGPPGVGKSSLLSRMIREWRDRGRSVALLAVDPSSRRSGGSLLGDRARIETDPHDRCVFIRSTAAGERLGGLAPATRSAARALAAAFDLVVIETVGVGQSETDIADTADTVAVVLQPASGDVLQFLKAGIMEVPDVLVLTESDLGSAARRASSVSWRRCSTRSWELSLWMWFSSRRTFARSIIWSRSSTATSHRSLRKMRLLTQKPRPTWTPAARIPSAGMPG